MKARLSQSVAVLFSLLLLAAIITIVIRGHGLEALADVWRRASPSEILLAVVAVLCMQLTSAWRTQILLHADGLPRPSLPALFRLQLVSQFVAHGAPISALADAAKVGMLALRFELPFGRSLRLIAYERITGAIGPILIGVVTLIVQLFMSVPASVLYLQAAVWAAGLGGIAVLVCAPMLHMRTGIKILDKIADATSMLAVMLRRPSVAVELLLSSVLQLASMTAAFLILARAMHIDIAAGMTFLLMPSIFFIASLPIFYLGWGAREAAVILTIGATSHISTAEATGLSVAFGVAVFLAALPGAVFWAMRPSMRKSIGQAKDALEVPEGR
jgi:hypothetical protein